LRLKATQRYWPRRIGKTTRRRRKRLRKQRITLRDSERFWPALREKLISWRSIWPSLRLITGIAVAQSLAAATIIALHGLPTAQLSMGRQSGRAIHMAIPYFWVGVIFMWVSVSFLTTGALMMRWPFRLLALALFTGFTLSPGALPRTVARKSAPHRRGRAPNGCWWLTGMGCHLAFTSTAPRWLRSSWQHRRSTPFGWPAREVVQSADRRS
jgi:hypothetical protein